MFQQRIHRLPIGSPSVSNTVTGHSPIFILLADYLKLEALVLVSRLEETALYVFDKPFVSKHTKKIHDDIVCDHRKRWTQAARQIFENTKGKQLMLQLNHRKHPLES
jgi:hypothetical protein